MRLAIVALAATLLWTIPAMTQVPDQFIVHQNDPNPFCPLDFPGGTTIMFAMAHAAYVTLEVLSPDTLSVVRTLLEEHLSAGFHAVTWDGRDSEGVVVPEGVYPYVFTVTDSPGGAVIFEDMLFATACCATPADGTGWGHIKWRFRTESRSTAD